MKTITLHIKGMHCHSCEMLLQDILEEEGVTEAKLSHEKGTATVTYNEKKLTETKIKAIIEQEGYTII